MEGYTSLGPTAALVMIWARDLYRSGSAARFYSCLDLSAGERMRQECETICPWYGEVILNRKWYIKQFAAGFIEGSGTRCQIIIPAAGKSPLALELLDTCSDTISSVIEIDIMGMEEKQRLYEWAAPSHAEKICCVSADLCDRKGTARAIRETGRYNPVLPTCIVTEGISYYLPPAVLSGIVSLFRSESRQNGVILEYLLPCRLIREERRRFPRGIWRIINRDCDPGLTIIYSPDEMEQTLDRAGCIKVTQHHMHDIERHRTGRNRYFPAISDGWIQIATARL
jgi:O-methyltransferase involved in polyketide biosynthesis